MFELLGADVSELSLGALAMLVALTALQLAREAIRRRRRSDRPGPSSEPPEAQ